MRSSVGIRSTATPPKRQRQIGASCDVSRMKPRSAKRASRAW